jgi:chaperonin GroEL (HSP60 family)
LISAAGRIESDSTLLPAGSHRQADEEMSVTGPAVAMMMITGSAPDVTPSVRSALQNAASVAGLLLTTECIVAEHQEETGTDTTSSTHSGNMHPQMT